jgi:hypothetical protein
MRCEIDDFFQNLFCDGSGKVLILSSGQPALGLVG